MAREGAEDREFFIYLLIHSNKLAYLQLLIVWFTEAVLSKVMNIAKTLKICANEFIFRSCNFRKFELFRSYFSRILFKSFTGLLLQNTSLHMCSNSKYRLCPVSLRQSRIMLAIRSINFLKAFGFLTMCFSLDYGSSPF